MQTPTRLKEYQHEYYLEHKDDYLRRSKEWRKTPQGIRAKRAWEKRNRDKLRAEVIDLLGGKCVRCGFSDARALQLDHINGGGSKENGFRRKVWRSYLKDPCKLREVFQLLCANCNSAKALFSSCPHNKGKPSTTEVNGQISEALHTSPRERRPSPVASYR
jgi:hypothetical protein